MGWDEVLTEEFLYGKAIGRIPADKSYDEWLREDSYEDPKNTIKENDNGE